MTVLFIGPLPPPVHGFSSVNQSMLERLSRHTKVREFDRARRCTSHLRFVLLWLLSICRFAFYAAIASPKRDSVYLGLSGGNGQWLDLPFIALSRIRGLRVFLHHHSYAYLNAPTFLMRLTVSALGANAQHIVLCHDMRVRLYERYGVMQSHTAVLSNIAFMGPASDNEPAERRGDSPLVLGFLSNITEEKGIFEFLDAIATCQQNGIALTGLIAGPIDDRIRGEVESRLRDQCESIKYLGPVYGKAKEDFFRSIDLLVFPSKYVNEAEPLVILESLREGVPVIATPRGCVGGMLNGALADQQCSCVNLGDLAATISRFTQTVRSRDASTTATALAIRREFHARHNYAVETLDALLMTMIKGGEDCR